VFAEESLVARLKAGQLDAGFFYASEAKAAGIPTVPLTGQTLKATYTVTVLNNAPHQTVGEAFVAYLLGPATSILAANGYTLITPPTLSGSGVPPSLQPLFTS
jgi:molybdate/tungstate transport system substrate-binding protein